MTSQEQQNPRISAIALLSGGLDSQLAVCVLREQGIGVQGVVFESPFFSADKAQAAAAHLGIPLHVADFSGEIIGLIKNPRHGFGRGLNPCIDCHATMIRRAGELMEKLGLNFIATGEVLNERPMSQNRRSLDIVAGESGYGDRVLRPLSAALLPETLPERMGWVDRSRLPAIQGRRRKPQMLLAERFGLKYFPSPAGGCRLTEPNFCRRLEDLQMHEGLDSIRSLVRLRYGRHFRLGENIKLIVGRNEEDNHLLELDATPGDRVLTTEDFPGPTAVLPVTADEDQLREAAAICARYSDGPRDREAAVSVRSAGETRVIKVLPALPDEADRRRV